MFFLCHEHKLAAKSFWGLRGHWNMKHTGQPMPAPEEVQSEDIPEGYAASSYPARAKEKAQPREPTGDGGSQAQESVLEEITELPSHPVELFRTLLQVNGVGKADVAALTQRFRLNKHWWNNGQAILKMLSSSKIKGITVSEDWVSSFLDQYTASVKLPSGFKGAGFIPGQGAMYAGGMGFMGGAPPTDPIGYLVWERMQERAARAESPAADPETKERLNVLENTLNQLLDINLKRQEAETKDREKAETDRRFAQLEAKVEKKGGDEEGGGFLKQYLAERDKRMEDIIDRQNDTIKDLGTRLERAASEVASARDAVGAARADAVAQADAARKKAKDELEAAGWSSRQKSEDEHGVELLKDLLPLADRRFGKFQESLDGLLKGGLPAPGGGAARNPASSEEAQKIAAAMTIQERLRQGR